MTAVNLCLVGIDVSGSPSPAMHNAALRAASLDGEYTAISLQPRELPGFLARLRDGEWRGVNVTMPYKAALASACDRLDGDARILEVVNTLTVDGDEVVGDNTDAQGFEMGLSVQRAWPLPECRAVVLGGGGAAAAVALALTRVPAADILVAARREESAHAIASQLGDHGALRASGWESADLRQALAGADIVVNATPAGAAAMPFVPRDLQPSCTVADVRYRPRPVDLVARARMEGRRGCDGLEMLLFQGMLGFQRWTGADPPWESARQALQDAVE